MPILQQRSRRTAQSHAGPPASSRSAVVPSAELPPYEPPMFLLDDESKQMLASLSGKRHNQRLQENIKRSMQHLQQSVALLNDRARTRRQLAESSSAKRQKVGNSEEQAEEKEKEKRLAELDAKVVQLTEEHEAAFRELVDFRNELEDEKDVIKMMRDEVDAQQPKVRPRRAVTKNRPKQERSRRRQDGCEDEEDEDDDQDPEVPIQPQDSTPYTGASDILKKARVAKAEEYFGISAQERYAKDNDYIAFRGLLHDATNSEDVPLPHASKWFDREGKPVLNVQAGAGAEDESDDDIRIEREIIDIRCPLSASIMTNPMSSKVCKHTFEKEHILAYVGRGPAKCPVCSLDMRKEDLFPDEIMLRRIKRQVAQLNHDDSDDSEDEGAREDEGEDGEFMDIRKAAQVKRDPGTEDIED